MNRTPLPVIVAIVALTAATAYAGDARCVAADVDGSGETCCFTNPRFTGVCKVTPGPDETCSDILAYLNNQASVGKTYCGNTKIRGGWVQVDCEQPAETRTGEHRQTPHSE